jgi:hypothetical protein
VGVGVGVDWKFIPELDVMTTSHCSVPTTSLAIKGKLNFTPTIKKEGALDFPDLTDNNHSPWQQH